MCRTENGKATQTPEPVQRRTATGAGVAPSRARLTKVEHTQQHTIPFVVRSTAPAATPRRAEIHPPSAAYVLDRYHTAKVCGSMQDRHEGCDLPKLTERDVEGPVRVSEVKHGGCDQGGR